MKILAQTQFIRRKFFVTAVGNIEFITKISVEHTVCDLYDVLQS